MDPRRIPFCLFACLISACMMTSCDPNLPVPPNSLDGPYPLAPENLVVSMRGDMIDLTWTIVDSTVDEFYVYRQDGLQEPARRIAQTREKKFTDSNIVSGNWNYGYSVSAVSEDGYEGRRSGVQYVIATSEVFLLTPVTLDTFPSALRLSWTVSIDSSNFAAYQLYRSLTPEVNLGSTVVATLTGRLTLTYVDRGLHSDTDYSYRVYVFNRNGGSTPSNVVTTHTAADAPPPAVSLALPAPDSSGLRLSWSRSTAVDFASYRIFRATQSPVDVSALPISILSEVTTTSYVDRGLTRGVIYYYRIAVYDRAGLYTGSNEVGGMIR